MTTPLPLWQCFRCGTSQPPVPLGGSFWRCSQCGHTLKG